MGQRQLNLSVNTDYATPEKDTAVELHMALAIPYNDLPKVQEWFDSDDWSSVRKYLIARYPEHRQCLEAWIAGCEVRSLAGRTPTLSVAC